MKKVAVISLGCAKNLVDSEVMLGFLEEAGYRIYPDPEGADIIIVNTCGFIQPARLESEAAFRRTIDLKRRDGGKILVAAGCYVERERTPLRTRFPEIDFWTGVKDFHHIVDLLEKRPYRESEETFLYDHRSPRRRSTPPASAYLKISEGCSHRCGFCAIPMIKGPYRSRSIESIRKEAHAMAGQGIREINLISQDSASFASDRRQKNGLARLLQSLLDVAGLKWIRVLYAYPERITDELLEVMNEEKICSYFDAPFQHADPGVLRAMRRGMDGPAALELIARIRRRVPDAVLRSSLIVGFPGEGSREFRRLGQFVRDAEIDHLGVFTYSPEPGTSCFVLGDPVPDEEKESRRAEIMEMQAGISRRRNLGYVGRRLEVLLEGHIKDKPDLWVARTQYQAPEVDGVVFIDTTDRTPDPSDPMPSVEITHSEVYDLYAKLRSSIK